MSQITFLLDPGHGGIVDGKYTTAPNFDKNNKSTWKKCWHHEEEDLTLFEGVFNRQVIGLVKSIMDMRGMKYIDVVNSEFDISLKERVSKANAFYSGDKNCVYFSMHGNASGSGKGHGIEIFTSIGQTQSDKDATLVFDSIVEFFPDEKYRKDTWSDGDVDKEANYYVLKNTAMSAMLLEMWFFDNLSDAKKMNDVDIQHQVAKAIVNGFEKIQDAANQA
jgi:N-acetylmuramoyl-L-alanine amidase